MGTQEMFLISPDTTVAMTSLNNGRESMQNHVERLLDHTELRAIEWINMHHHDITLTTIPLSLLAESWGPRSR